MRRTFFLVTFIVWTTAAASAQRTYTPVTPEMMRDPSPNDWLMYSRTYDAQRFSPLEEIDRSNAGRLVEVWKNDLAPGTIEIIPVVHDGVMFVMVPVQVDGSGRTAVQALDAATGEMLWQYARPNGGVSRAKTLALYGDMVIFAAPDNHIVALDAQTGAVRWETESTGGLGSGTIVFGNRVLTGRTCGGARANCYVASHDARTGEEQWRFYTAAGSDDPEGDASWGGAPEETRTASTWGLGGSYDPERDVIYWGVANPTPNTRADRHGGDIDAIGRTAPADLYSNSTVAIDAATGELIWYYQHLPGDDWDQDFTNERVLVTSEIRPDTEDVKWANPTIPPGEVHDVVVNVGEGGGIFALDRETGQFLWADPFPYDVENFLISDIDPVTGITTINSDVTLDEPGEQHVICAYNTKSYWPMSYHPGRNALYIPYVDDCLDMTRSAPAPPGARAEVPAPAPEAGRGGRGGRGAGDDGSIRERRQGVRRPGSDPEKYAGIAKIDVATGEIERIYEGSVPGNGATLVTAGDVVFWGDLDQNFRAFDAEDGTILWETRLGGPIQNSTITYAVDGRQYVAVLTGLGAVTSSLFARSGVDGIDPERNNAIHVFALPE